MVASVKHLAAYGQPEGGRDYNTTDLSEQRLRNLYLPPFKAAVDAGADTAMCSFNAINGVPGCANSETETQILKQEWGFDGFIESDYTAVDELRACPPKTPDTGPCGHGVAADGPSAGALALNAGTDMEMVSTNIRDYGAQLLAKGRISIARVNDAVRRILRVKFRAGLFEHPYVDVTKAASAQLRPDAVAAARGGRGPRHGAAQERPLHVAAGPRQEDRRDRAAGRGPARHAGPLVGAGSGRRRRHPVRRDQGPEPGRHVRPGMPGGERRAAAATNNDVCGSTTGFAAAVATAKSADQVVLALGENREMSGEAAARSTLDLPGYQQQLIDAIRATGKPFVVVLFNGRPLTLGAVAQSSPAILEAWFPGVQAGNSVADVLFGRVNPGGKLPVSFPQVLGQVPIYYNHEPTGRPCDVTQKYTSRYRDLPTCAPLYEFGYGLSYSTFSVTNLRLDRTSVSPNGRVQASVDVTNTGKARGDEVVQLYLHDPVASISQPVRRLRGFERVTLDPGARRTITFTLDRSDFGFYDNRGRFVVEPGEIDLYAGDSSAATLTRSFTVG